VLNFDKSTSNSFKKRGSILSILKSDTIGFFSKRKFLILAFFAILGTGGVVAATNISINSSSPVSLGAGYTAATACDENMTVKALTALDAATGQLYVATIALSDISQNATTGCGQKVMEAALKINGQMLYTSWSIPADSTDNTFTFGGATNLVSDYYAITALTPFKADGLTNIAISQIASWTKRLISAGGGQHTCALLSTGAVKCWGSNSYGQLGDGSTTQRTTPVDVSGLSSGVTAISAGYLHSCALLNTGAVKCWGYNAYGQLGDGSTTRRTTPVDVSGLSSGVTAITTSYHHTCALLNTGAVKCWGYNGSGQLGDGTSGTDRLTPVDVSGLSSGVTAISAGYYSTCALLSTGAVKCWGTNTYGQLGDGTSGTNRLTPVDVSGLSSGVTAISGGYYYTCALLNTGAVKCWGYNGFGQLGDGSTTQSLTPVGVLGIP
jgi:alpha-tubulin suppressor-like RCC1 family protein